MNIKGGLGRNVPCDLHNEHVNKLIKEIIVNMGSNLTEVALQRAVRSISTLAVVCQRFDSQSNVPHHTTAHSDLVDINKVIGILMNNKILHSIGSRAHKCFTNIHLNPLHKWKPTATKNG